MFSSFIEFMTSVMLIKSRYNTASWHLFLLIVINYTNQRDKSLNNQKSNGVAVLCINFRRNVLEVGLIWLLGISLNNYFSHS